MGTARIYYGTRFIHISQSPLKHNRAALLLKLVTFLPNPRTTNAHTHTRTHLSRRFVKKPVGRPTRNCRGKDVENKIVRPKRAAAHKATISQCAPARMEIDRN